MLWLKSRRVPRVRSWTEWRPRGWSQDDRYSGGSRRGTENLVPVFCRDGAPIDFMIRSAWFPIRTSWLEALELYHRPLAGDQRRGPTAVLLRSLLRQTGSTCCLLLYMRISYDAGCTLYKEM